MGPESDGRHRGKVLRLVELNTEQIRSLDRDKTVVLMPGGILEEHGPYLPCFTDGYLNERLTHDLANAIVSRPGWTVLVFPTIPLGTGGANGIGRKATFPGTFAVRPTTLRAVFMDLASELGEQGFRWIFVLHLHGAPDHNRALQHACDYFSDVYGGKMANLTALVDMEPLFHGGLLSAEDQEADGYGPHADAIETSCVLYLKPRLVDPAYREAPPQRGENWEELVRVASAPGWPGYLGSPAHAKAAYGATFMDTWAEQAIALARRILAGEEVGSRSGYGITASTGAAFEEDPHKLRQKQEWLEKNGVA